MKWFGAFVLKNRILHILCSVTVVSELNANILITSFLEVYFKSKVSIYKGSNYFLTMSKLTSAKWFCELFSALDAIIIHIVSVGYGYVSWSRQWQMRRHVWKDLGLPWDNEHFSVLCKNTFYLFLLFRRLTQKAVFEIYTSKRTLLYFLCTR